LTEQGRRFDPIMPFAKQAEALQAIRAVEGRATSSVRILILRNYSAEYLEPFLRAYFLRAGFDVTVVFGGYDTVFQDIATPTFPENADLVVVSLVLDALAPDWLDGRFTEEDVAARVVGLLDACLEHASVPVVFNTFIRPLGNPSPPALQEGSVETKIAGLNDLLRKAAAARAPRAVLLDFERLVMMLGVEQALDARMAYLAAAPFRQGFLGAYAFELFKLGRALKGGTKKCLILDCDGTLWGGVLGELGAEGIALDRNEYPGRAYYDFQRSVVRLAERGVMVALCSKNNPEDVLAVLDQHPHCLLKREHLVGTRINWEAKEKNIASLVEELNIGMDAVVFVDDSPIECERVAAFLPAVTVRQVPRHPFLLPSLLDAEGLFDSLATTQEDRQRARLYQAEARRRQAEVTFDSPESFLASLQLAARVAPAAPGQFPRVAQLTQKTNQFNLTARRYSEAEVAAMAADPDWAVYTMTPSDRFGDLGLSAVLLAHRVGDTVHFDSFLMSCRILGRELERQFIAVAAKELRARWMPQRWTADYCPTQKNQQVSRFWEKFGFTDAQTLENGTVAYTCDDADLRADRIPFITVEQ